MLSTGIQNPPFCVNLCTHLVTDQNVFVIIIISIELSTENGTNALYIN